MPISGDQQLDKNQRRFSLPLDSCVGDAGPSPTEVTTISQPGGKIGPVPNELRINGGKTEFWGQSKGKSPAQSDDVRGAYTTGYDGPSPS